MKRDDILAEMQARLAPLANVYRNPSEEIAIENMPMINLYELTDSVLDVTMRGRSLYPIYKRQLSVVLEVWIHSEEGKVNRDIFDLLNQSRRAIYADGVTLGGLAVEVREQEMSKLFRAEIPATAGIGCLFLITYIDNLNEA